MVFSDMQFASAGGNSAVLRSVQKRYKTHGWSLGDLRPSRLMLDVGGVVGNMLGLRLAYGGTGGCTILRVVASGVIRPGHMS